MAITSPVPAFDGVRRAVKQTLFSIGYYHQRLSQVSFPGIAVLCYHGIRGADDTGIPFADLHVCEDVFESHCRLLATACNPISLNDLRAAIAGTRPLPARPVLVTFDDGYRSVLERALPSLERHGVPAVVFVTSRPVLRSHHFWFDALWQREGEDAVLRARRATYAEWVAISDSVTVASQPGDAHRPMTLEELKRLAASPLIEIGGHTMRHPVLALAPLDVQREEIAGCRVELQNALGASIDAFAYPFGLIAEHYRTETVNAVREAGFDLAFTTNPSFAAVHEHPYEIPRFLMLDSVKDVELAHRLTRSWPMAEELA